MSQLPQANFQNPGQEVWMNGYLVLPGLSGARVDLYSDGPFLKEMNLNNQFSLSKITRKSLITENSLSVNAASTLLGFGFKHKAGFFHVKFREHFVSNVQYPKSLFGLIDNYNTEATSYNSYALNSLNINAAHYRSYSFGYTHRFANISIGGNLQYLQGIANLNITNNNLGITYSKDDGGYSVQGKLEALTSGADMYSDPKTTNFLKGSGNSGFAIDLGGVVHFSPKFELSFAALDLGKIFWKKHISETSMLDATTFFQAKDSEEFSTELEDKFEALFDEEVISNSKTSYQTLLRQKYLLGAKYFFRPATSVGLLLHSDVLNGEANFGGSISLNTQYKEHLGFTFAVSKYQNEKIDIGTGFNINFGPVQIYAVTDNVIALFSQKESHKLQGQAGINFIFGKKTRKAAVVIPGELPMAQTPPARVTDPYQPPVFIEKSTGDLNTADEEEKSGLPEGYIEYKAQVSDSESNKPLADVKITIYRLKSRRVQILFHSETSKDGSFSLPISRIDTHRVVVQKPGYIPLEKEYSPGIIEKNSDTLSLYFFLVPEVKDPETINKTVESAIAEITDMPPGDKMTSYGIYHLKGSTSLRKGAHHTERILRRLRTNDEVEVIEKTTNLWWKVKHGIRVGYVKADYLEKEYR
jgi:hypothetical protein